MDETKTVAMIIKPRRSTQACSSHSEDQLSAGGVRGTLPWGDDSSPSEGQPSAGGVGCMLPWGND